MTQLHFHSLPKAPLGIRTVVIAPTLINQLRLQQTCFFIENVIYNFISMKMGVCFMISISAKYILKGLIHVFSFAPCKLHQANEKCFKSQHKIKLAIEYIQAS